MSLASGLVIFISFYVILFYMWKSIWRSEAYAMIGYLMVFSLLLMLVVAEGTSTSARGRARPLQPSDFIKHNSAAGKLFGQELGLMQAPLMIFLDGCLKVALTALKFTLLGIS